MHVVVHARKAPSRRAYDFTRAQEVVERELAELERRFGRV